MSDDLSLFDDERDVEVRTPTLARVLLTLLGAGVLVAFAVVVITSLLTAHRTPTGALCTGDGCGPMSVSQVSEFTGLPLPADAEVTRSAYQSNDERILVEASVRLPPGSPNPFDSGPYAVVGETSLELPPGEPFGYYEASGEGGSLQADGALVEAVGGDIVVVRVERTL